jgi:hypothetical protein
MKNDLKSDRIFVGNCAYDICGKRYIETTEQCKKEKRNIKIETRNPDIIEIIGNTMRTDFSEFVGGCSGLR